MLKGSDMSASPAIVDARATSPDRPRLRPVEAPAGSRTPRSRIVLRACRPRQWVKNVVVMVAPASAGALTRPAAVAHVAGAIVAFCLLSSATYLVNDVRDRASDRRHPRKRLRPVAAGELSPQRALKIAAVLAAGGVALSGAIRPALGAVAISYLALTLSYSIVWRQVVVADIVMVAAGFLVRAAAGGVAADVRLSSEFLVVTSACALFLVAGKRYAEAGELHALAGTRQTLSRYSGRALRALLFAAAAIGCVAYARWAFTRPGVGPWVELSLIPYTLWLGRYWNLVQTGGGDAPEQLILSDPALLALGAAWAILFVTGLYVAP